MKNQLDSFTFEGIVFKPLRNLKGKASDFSEISKRITNSGIAPDNWDYKRFYEVAKENNADVDLFEVSGKVVIPAENYLFEYK